MACPGECTEKSVDLHEVLKKTARTAEISATIMKEDEIINIIKTNSEIHFTNQ